MPVLDMGAVPVVVGVVQPGTPADEAGLKPGDRIVSFNGEAVRNNQQAKTPVQKYKSAPISVLVERDGKPLTLTATVRKLEDGTERLGFDLHGPTFRSKKRRSEWPWNMHSARIGKPQGNGFSPWSGLFGARSVKDSGLGGPVGIFQQSAEATRIMG